MLMCGCFNGSVFQCVCLRQTVSVSDNQCVREFDCVSCVCVQSKQGVSQYVYMRVCVCDVSVNVSAIVSVRGGKVSVCCKGQCNSEQTHSHSEKFNF